jgi:nucleotide-binding universal stress UspA family protein
MEQAEAAGRTDGRPRRDDTGPDGHGLIVVGLTATPASRAALRWAAECARRNGTRLSVICVHPPKHLNPSRTADPDLRLDWSVQARQTIDREFAVCRPEPDWTLTQLIGDPGPELVRAAQDAGLLVIGRHRAASATRRAPVASYCVETSPVPVVVVPAPGDARVAPESTRAIILQADH